MQGSSGSLSAILFDCFCASVDFAAVISASTNELTCNFLFEFVGTDTDCVWSAYAQLTVDRLACCWHRHAVTSCTAHVILNPNPFNVFQEPKVTLPWQAWPGQVHLAAAGHTANMQSRASSTAPCAAAHQLQSNIADNNPCNHI